MRLLTPMQEAGQQLPSGVQSIINPPPAQFEQMSPQERMLAMARGEEVPPAAEPEENSFLEKQKRLMMNKMKGEGPKPAKPMTPYPVQTPMNRGKQVG